MTTLRKLPTMSPSTNTEPANHAGLFEKSAASSFSNGINQQKTARVR